MLHFRGPIRMHNGVATSFDISIKDKVGKELFCDMIDRDCYSLVQNIYSLIPKLYSLIRNDTCQGVCTTDEQRFVALLF